MSEEPSESTLSAVLSELRELKKHVLRIEARQGSATAAAPPKPQLKVYYGRIEMERKSFLVRMDGIISATLRLSSLRATLLLVLLVDLQDRLDGGRGITNIVQAAAGVWPKLDAQATQGARAQNSLRVGLYRLEHFISGNSDFSGADFRLVFNPADSRLAVSDAKTGKAANRIDIDLSTNDRDVAAVLDEVMSTSPLARVRKRKVLYVPGGREGFDRLLLELYEHSHPLVVKTLYFRPAIQSYPTRLLEAIGMSDRNIHRKEVVFEGYRTGRCRFLEILNFETIWDMIRFVPDVGFKLYPRTITAEHVEQHLEHLIYKIETFPTFELVLTDASFPFYLGTFDIHTQPVPEHITIFFRRFSRDYVHDVSCFVLSDEAVSENISKNIIDWILAHPSTVRDRGEVVSYIKNVIERLRNEGPLLATSLVEP